MTDYLRDPAEIYRRSFATIEAEVDWSRLPESLRSIAPRLIHACGMIDIVDDLAWSGGLAERGRAALKSGAKVIADCHMAMDGVIRERLPANNDVLCTLNEPSVRELAAQQKTTRSAAAVDLWRPHLAGAVVTIGNAPTALFRLLELLADGAPKPAVILAFPVGFVGAAESKDALIAENFDVPYLTLRGRRGGSAMAAAAVNALAGDPPQ